jgi:hypothetical protein
MTERRIPIARRHIILAQAALADAMEILEPRDDREPPDDPRDPPRRGKQLTPEERRRKYLADQGEGEPDYRDELKAPEIEEVGELDGMISPNDNPEEILRNALEGTLHPVIGVNGRNHGSLRLATSPNYGVRGDIRATFVGQTGDAELRGVTLGSSGGFVHELEFRDMLLATPHGQRAAVKDVGEWGSILIHRCGLLPDASYPNNYQGAGMKWGIHLSDGQRLHVAECYRAHRHEDGTPVRYQEHWAYLLDVDEVYFVGNDMSGGNRTGFQIRTPGSYGTLDGKILVEYNDCNDYGWDWGDNYNGGSAFTVWENLGVTEIRNNRVRNAKYGCLALAQQPPSQQPTLNENGYPIGRVVIHGNDFSNPKGDRACASMSATDSLFVYDGAFEGGSKFDIVVDAKTSLNWGAKRCNNVTFGRSVSQDRHTWNGSAWVPYPL